MQDCLFCKIANGEIETKLFWEDENYVAFLDINPMAKGMTLVVPKKHVGSNVMTLEDKEITDAMVAIRQVAKILDEKLEGNLRTTLLFEGIEVPHLHAKLIPLYKEDLANRPLFKTTREELLELSDYLAS